MSTVEVNPSTDEGLEESDNLVQKDETPEKDEATVPQKEIIRYSLSTLLSFRSSKLSQGKPACKNLDLACMAHHKPPPKMLIANMMPKFALNQMQNRGEESISPLSFHSNSSSSSNLSYQKRFQDNNREGESYSNSRYYYNKYKNYEDNGSPSTRIIYKTTGANANNSNNIRFLKKAYNSKYDNPESSGLLSNKNILENSSRVITAADHRNLKKTIDLSADDDKKNEKSDDKKPTPDEMNNNEDSKKEEGKVNAKELTGGIGEGNDLKHLPDDISNHLDDMFNNMNQMLPEKITDERESSRFSKWFTVNKDESKDESVPDLQNNNDMFLCKSVESEKYFQPIDKVESNSLSQLLKGKPEAQQDENPLMQIMQNQSQQQKSPNGGQVHSVEELEARLRHHKSSEEHNNRKSSEGEQKALKNFFHQQLMPNLIQQQQQQQQQKQQQHHQQSSGQNQEDVNAFKKLLSQMANDDNKIPQNGPNLPQHMMMKPFPQYGADLMIQQQQQKNFPMAGKIPSKMINSTQHMMPQQQFGGNVDMMKILQQQPKMPIPQLPEIMKRPEVQAIVQELTSGEISQYSLWQRLTTPGLSPIERDIITSALNFFNSNSNPNGNLGLFPKQIETGNLFSQMKPAAPITMPQGSPLSPVPPSLDHHLLFQHQAAAVAANKLRLSPLPAAGIPQRIPSPRELQYHTQSIMQNALIRKKLEEQRENFRKRQEQEQKEQIQKQGGDRKNPELDGAVSPPNQSPVDVPKIGLMDSPIKKAPAQQQLQRQHAPSPSMFTPTSVLRKMTAEKESDGKMGSDKKKAITGAQLQQQPRNQQQHQFMGNLSQLDRMMQIQAQNDAFAKVNWDAQSSMKPQGRPIVKGAGPGSVQPPQTNPMMTQGPQQPNMMVGNFDFHQQQQQIQKLNMQKQFIQQQQQQQILQMKKQQQMDNPVLTQLMAQHQQRTQQQQQQQHQQQNMVLSQQFPQQLNYQQQMMQGRSKEQDEMENRNMTNNGGCLSPTSNQLAKWFSPELLADASAGKLPSMKMNGQMLSLEEFEKCIQNS